MHSLRFSIFFSRSHVKLSCLFLVFSFLTRVLTFPISDSNVGGQTRYVTVFSRDKKTIHHDFLQTQTSWLKKLIYLDIQYFIEHLLKEREINRFGINLYTFLITLWRTSYRSTSGVYVQLFWAVMDSWGQ